MDKIDRVCKFNGSTSTPLSFADGSDEPGEMTWQIRPHEHLTWTITCIFFFFFFFLGWCKCSNCVEVASPFHVRLLFPLLPSISRPPPARETTEQTSDDLFLG